MRVRLFFVVAAVLVVALVAGYAAGRFQSGRYAVYFATIHGPGGSGGAIHDLCRYDTITGRTWISRPFQDGTSALWKEVSESNEFIVTREAAEAADRKEAEIVAAQEEKRKAAIGAAEEAKRKAAEAEKAAEIAAAEEAPRKAAAIAAAQEARRKAVEAEEAADLAAEVARRDYAGAQEAKNATAAAWAAQEAKRKAVEAEKAAALYK